MNSATGNRTPVIRVTGGYTNHYTITDYILWKLDYAHQKKWLLLSFRVCAQAF